MGKENQINFKIQKNSKQTKKHENDGHNFLGLTSFIIKNILVFIMENKMDVYNVYRIGFWTQL